MLRSTKGKTNRRKNFVSGFSSMDTKKVSTNTSYKDYGPNVVEKNDVKFVAH